MISIGNWCIRFIPEDKRIDRFHNYKEYFFIYFKGNLCGTIQKCDFDKKWWVRILNEKIRKEFYKDNKRFYTKKIVKLKNGEYIFQKRNHALADELVRLYELDTETKRRSDDFCFRVIMGELFDRVYEKKVKESEIIKDIKNACKGIDNYLNDKEIKKSIIEIFQIQDLVLDLHYKCCKKRKSGSFWDLCNL